MSNNNDINYNYNDLPPFKWYVLSNFPFIEADFDAITNYQLLCKIVEYLNMVIASQNNVGEQVELLTNAFNNLKDYVDTYFDTLDLQEEVNIKIDEMVEDGTLTNLIKEYVDPIYEGFEDEINTRMAQQDTRIQNQNSQIAAQNTRIEAIESGSPLVASSTSEMTDTTRVYVNTSDGYWYYYDGDSWEQGGLYQSEIVPYNIDVYNLKFGNTGKQLYNVNQVDAMGYYNNSANFVSNSSLYGTYIDLTKVLEEGYTKLTPAAKGGGLNFLYCGFTDANKNGISGHCYAPLNPLATLDIPSNAKYFYVCGETSYKSNILVYAGESAQYELKYKRILDATINNYEKNKCAMDNKLNPENISFIHNSNNICNMNSKTFEEGIIYSAANGTSKNIVRAANSIFNSILFDVKPSSEITISTDEVTASLGDTYTIGEVFEYDEYMNFIYYSKVFRYNLAANKGLITFTTNANTKYVRVSCLNNISANAKIYCCYDDEPTSEEYSIIIDGLNVNTKQPYQSGFIPFSVKVNQTPQEITSYDNTVIDSENFVNVNCVLKLPTSYTPNGTPSKLIMICHGAGRLVIGDSEAWINVTPYNNLVNKLVNAGYVVFDCNGANNTDKNNFYGSPIGIETWKKAYQYVVDNYNVEKDFSIYGFSMGGLTALNIINTGFPNIKSVALGSPAINEELWWTAQVAQYFSTTTTQYSDDLVAGYNPMLNISNNKIDKKFPPIKIWYGGNEDGTDITVIDKNIAQTFVNALKNGNNCAYYREVTGQGHSICYGGNANVNTEILYWFNRF